MPKVFNVDRRIIVVPLKVDGRKLQQMELYSRLQDDKVGHKKSFGYIKNMQRFYIYVDLKDEM